jgi:RNA polymerase sigma-70 factor (ECF subfamily)
VISDQHRAEDITQEAFLRLVRQLLATEGHIKLRAWLHRTATNLAIDEHRRSRTLQQYQEQRSPLEELHRTLDRTDKGHPEQEAESSEVRQAIREVIATLPVRYRAILRRRFTEAYQLVSSDTAPPMRRRRRRGAPPLA